MSVRLVETADEIAASLRRFNAQARDIPRRTRNLLTQTEYWVYDETTDTFGPSKFLGFAKMDMARYDEATEKDTLEHFHGHRTAENIQRVLGREYRRDSGLSERLVAWGNALLGEHVFESVDEGKWRFVRLKQAPVHTSDFLAVGEVYAREDLKAMFNISDRTVYTGIFQPEGHRSVWLFVTENKPADRTQYTDLLRGNTLHWEGQTKGRKDDLIMTHEAENLELLLFYRRSKGQFDNYGFTYEGPFKYISHEPGNPDEDIPSKFVLRSACPEVLLEDALEQERERGQGYVSCGPVRVAVAMHAMDAAMQYFQRQGYHVEDVSKPESYDLRCTRDGEVLHVEVKGTQTEGEQVFLTANEVDFARRHGESMALFILRSVEVSDGPKADGGELRIYFPWNIDDGELRPIQFRYQTPPRDENDE